MTARTHLLLICLLLLSLAGCGRSTEESAPTSPTSTPVATPGPEKKKDPPSKRGVDFTMTPDEFAAELKDEKRATAMYKGKTFRITGTVWKYLRTSASEVQMIMNVPSKILGIDCMLTEAAPWNTAAPGQIATIVGVFPDSFIIPRLINCVIEEAKGPNESTMSIVDLVKRYESDPEGFVERYKHGCLVVTGIPTEKRVPSRNTLRVNFETGSKLKFAAEFGALNDERDGGRLRLGASSQVVGAFCGVDKETGELLLDGCLVANPSK